MYLKKIMVKDENKNKKPLIFDKSR